MNGSIFPTLCRIPRKALSYFPASFSGSIASLVILCVTSTKMAAARCFRTLSRLSSHRVAFLAARPSIVGFHYFSRSYIAMPSVVQLKSFQPGHTWTIQFRPFSIKPPTEEEVKETLLYVLKCFDKVNPEQVSSNQFIF